MTSKQVRDAATAYARKILGDERFKSDYAEAKKLMDAFKAGVSLVLFP